MSISQHKLIARVFHDREQAQLAVDALLDAGFKEDQIGVAAREGEAPVGTAALTGQESHAAEGAKVGALAGVGAGSLWAIAIASHLVPGVGPIIASTLIGSLLASAATGAVAGGLLGALIGLGIPEEDAKYYESQFRAGRTILTVQAADRSAEAASILDAHGGHDVHNPAINVDGVDELDVEASDLPEDESHVHGYPYEESRHTTPNDPVIKPR